MAKITKINVAEAKRSLSELLGRVAYGRESITILKRGRPMARLVPIEGVQPSPPIRGWLDDDDPFLAILDEIVVERHSHRPRATGRGKK
jgi:prevent-host-death family protein